MYWLSFSSLKAIFDIKIDSHQYEYDQVFWHFDTYMGFMNISFYIDKLKVTNEFS